MRISSSTSTSLQHDPTEILGCRFCLKPPMPVAKSGATLRAGGLIGVSVFDIRLRHLASCRNAVNKLQIRKEM
jgi:hypothetical protein